MDEALDLERTLADLLRILSEHLSMKRGAITLFDPDSGRLAITASHGLTPEERKRGVYALDEGVTGRVFQTAKPYVAPDIRKEPLFLDKTGARKLEKDQIAFIGVPILHHGAPIGVLNVDRLFDNSVDFEEDLGFLSVVATLISQFLSLNEKVRAREEALVRENVSLRSQLSRERRGPYIVGRSLAMKEVERQIEKVAPTRATVLLLGESGVGKTLIARIIHDLSERKKYAFVKVNCASIPENLLESELFGYERGAFTGAVDSKPGRFEDAHRGSIFLDEIGELPVGTQSKLLRVLQEKEFERLGGNRTRKVDVRIITATNKNLSHLSEIGSFRQDLYYRLNVFPLLVPPLRERKEDIPILLNHFLEKVAYDYGRTLSYTSEAFDFLARYDWPGNVREMENMIERLVIMAETDRIEAPLLRSLVDDRQPEPQKLIATVESRGASLKDIERNEIIASLRRNSWIRYKAAKELGLTERQMGYRAMKLGLDSLIAAERAALRAKTPRSPFPKDQL